MGLCFLCVFVCFQTPGLRNVFTKKNITSHTPLPYFFEASGGQPPLIVLFILPFYSGFLALFFPASVFSSVLPPRSCPLQRWVHFPIEKFATWQIHFRQVHRHGRVPAPATPRSEDLAMDATPVGFCQCKEPRTDQRTSELEVPSDRASSTSGLRS